MERIIGSRTALLFLAGAALLFGIDVVFFVAAWAAWTPSAPGTASDLMQAGEWLGFVAAAAALCGVATAGWELVLARNWVAAAETGGAVLGTLLLSVGLLIVAAAGDQDQGAHVVAAVGIALWAAVAVARAARLSLAGAAGIPSGSAGIPSGSAGIPSGSAGIPSGAAGSISGSAPQREALLWLIAAGGLAVLAIGWGFDPNLGGKAIAIAAGVLLTVGFGTLCACLGVGRADGHLGSRVFPAALTGLALLAGSAVAFTGVAAADFGGDVSGSVTGLRAGLAVTAAIELAGVVALGIAAWLRVRDLTRTAS